jgi:hypothetical protein
VETELPSDGGDYVDMADVIPRDAEPWFGFSRLLHPRLVGYSDALIE